VTYRGMMIILRGLPGSGKSDFAAELKHHIEGTGGEATVCSLDDYFTVDGVYHWDPSKIKENVIKLEDDLRRNMNRRVGTIIVANTHSRLREFQKYIDMAVAHAYKVRVLTVEAPVWECLKRQSHDVPTDSVLNMAQRWESMAPKSSVDHLAQLTNHVANLTVSIDEIKRHLERSGN